jgi:hypothetical protein
MRKVFIVNLNDKVDLEKVQEFGKVVVMTSNYVRVDAPDFVYRLIRKHLIEATDSDYLLLSGNSALCSIVALYWFMKFGVVNALVWKAHKRTTSTRGTYEPLTITAVDINRIENSTPDQP